MLTKPLGTGIITTALKRRALSESANSFAAAVRSMITLNSAASKVMLRYPVHACSDVTGFSLLGHSFEMASGSKVTLTLESDRLPLLEGAVALAEGGSLTGGCKRNRAYLSDKVEIHPSVSAGLVEVAFDPRRPEDC